MTQPSLASGARGLVLTPFLTFALLTVWAACTPEAEPAEGAPPVVNVVQEASAACLGGDASAAILRLDSLIAVDPRLDAYAVRAGCYRQRFARDSVRSDVEAAFADLGRAIEASGEGSTVAKDALYNQRAFVRLTMDPGDLGGMLSDLDAAVEQAPESAVHRADRSVARSMAGDTAGAREDLLWLTEGANADSARQAEARQRLTALE